MLSEVIDSSEVPVPVMETEALKADKDANEPGYARLPLLAKLLVPQLGFAKVFCE